MRFENLIILHLIWLLLPVLGWFYYRSFKRKRQDLEKLGNPRVLDKIHKNREGNSPYARMGLVLGATMFFLISLARPQYGKKEELIKRKGIDIMVAVDTSLSMNAEDVKPSRIALAKLALSQLIDRLRGDRIGLVAFAGTSFVQCPLTLDYNAVHMYLDALDTSIIPEPGTDLAGAIRTSTAAFNSEEKKYKALIILSDGEEHTGEVDKAAREAAEAGLVIFAVGMGTSTGEPIPLHKKNGGHEYKKDRSGNIVMSKLQPAVLQKIALLTNGQYYQTDNQGTAIANIYDKIRRMDKKELESRRFSQYEDRFQYVLVFGFLLLTLSSFLPFRRGEE
ncbi:MAG: VWA domain-containing protein [bacterium]